MDLISARAGGCFRQLEFWVLTVSQNQTFFYAWNRESSKSKPYLGSLCPDLLHCFALSPLKKRLLAFELLKPFKLNWAFIECFDSVLTLQAQLPHGHIKTQTKAQILNSSIAKQNHSQRNFEDVHSLCSLERMDRPSASLKQAWISLWLEHMGASWLSLTAGVSLHPLSIILV